MKTLILLLSMIVADSILSDINVLTAQGKPINYLAMSIEFLTAVRNKEKVDLYLQTWASCDLVQLSQQVETDQQKLAFWINMYNAYIQVILANHPEKYNDRGTFFKEKQIKLGGSMFSFEDIEHGILRRSQHPFLLGYFTRWFPDKTEKMLRIGKRDWRIHFALNCGAKSCPPVAIYDTDRIEEQLEVSTKNYLQKFSTYQHSDKIAYVTSLFSWFRGDFGGLEGIKNILIKQNIIPDTNVRLKTAEYDWTMDLANFVDL
ncbi:MAG: DUF547 domain-containing protein [Saprospiraceae bacterium]|jgi:hypothetical protein|nr:DUF547 domain-containing protein [Saprospiraceae bacterium]